MYAGKHAVLSTIASRVGMKKFIKDNIVLTLGISLPLVLVGLFMAASTLPKYLVADPQYDVFFSDGRYSYIEFQVQQQKLTMRVDPARYQNEKSLPHLYRYRAATGKTEEIIFRAPDMSKHQTLEGNNKNNINTNIVINVDPTKLPSQEQAQDTSKIVSEINKNNSIAPFTVPVAETAELNINTTPSAPDGYQFSNADYGYSNHGLLFLGGGSSYRNRGPVLSKSGKNIPVLHHNLRDSQYGSFYGSSHFIGWVIP